MRVCRVYIKKKKDVTDWSKRQKKEWITCRKEKKTSGICAVFDSLNEKVKIPNDKYMGKDLAQWVWDTG